MPPSQLPVNATSFCDATLHPDISTLLQRIAGALLAPNASTLSCDSMLLATAAAVIDGEGSIFVRHGQMGRYTLRQLSIQATNANPQYLVNCQRAVGLGSIDRSHRTASGRDIWIWRAHNRAAQMAVAALYPYLLIKAPQAAIAACYPLAPTMPASLIRSPFGRALREWCRAVIRILFAPPPNRLQVLQILEHPEVPGGLTALAIAGSPIVVGIDVWARVYALEQETGTLSLLSPCGRDAS